MIEIENYSGETESNVWEIYDLTDDDLLYLGYILKEWYSVYGTNASAKVLRLYTNLSTLINKIDIANRL